MTTTERLREQVRHSMVPMVLEESSRGERAFDIYSMLLRQRIVFLGQEVDDQVANLIISQMLYLEAVDPEQDIALYINSPGGLAYGGMAIYDVIQHIRPDVSTICVGMGMSAAAMVLCGGAPGKRFALPSARIMIHQGSAGTRGAPSDMEIQLREVLALTRRMAEIIAHHSAKSVDDVVRDIDRDKFMTPEEAIDYGLIDAIIAPRRGLASITGTAQPLLPSARTEVRRPRRCIGGQWVLIVFGPRRARRRTPRSGRIRANRSLSRCRQLTRGLAWRVG